MLGESFVVGSAERLVPLDLKVTNKADKLKEEEPPMSASRLTNEGMSRLVTELLEAWNAHDVDRVTTFYAPDYEGVDVGQARPQRGPEGIRQTLVRYLEAFPDLHFTEEATIIQGDRAAVAWTAQGTHRGKVMNIPPTGRLIQVRGVSILTVAEEKVSQALYVWDVAGLLRNLGLLPEL
jgi:steroid delta-isomerase-like uncharacterized protein